MLVLSVAGVGSAPAAVPVARDDVAAGLALAGEQVVWGSRAPGGGLEVRAAAPGGPATTLFAFPPTPGPGRQAFGGIAASDTHLAIVRVASRSSGPQGPVGTARSASEIPAALGTGTSKTTLVAGPLGGPFLHVAGRRGPSNGACRSATYPSQPVVWGSRLAYLESVNRCTPRGERVRDRIVVSDLARPGAAARVVARGTWHWPGSEARRGVDAVRMAGRYLAWQEIRPLRRALITAKVVDLRRGRVVRSVTRAPGGDAGDILEWFAVGVDGSLVLSFQPDASGHALALLDAAGEGGQVRLRPPLGTRGYEPATVTVSYRRGRIAFLAQTGRNEFGLVLARRRDSPAPLARFTDARPVVADPAWNGTYAAWASRRGRTTTIWRSGPFR